MIAVKLLPLVQVLVILFAPSRAYPTVYGTKRYGRIQRSYHASPYVRTHRYPTYYDMYPYSQTYPEEYYYDPPTYPVYYPRTSKYEVYQAVLPYYYDRPVLRTGFGYYGYDEADPITDIEEEMLHDAERKQREDAQPIGQETYFEDDASPSTEDSYYNDVNTAFLNNLIMSQMYKDSLDGHSYNVDNVDNLDASEEEVYGKVDSFPPSHSHSSKTYSESDEDELELRNLAGAKHNKQMEPDDRWSWFQKGSNKKNELLSDGAEKRSVNGRLQWFTDDRKTIVKTTAMPATITTTSTFAPKKVQQRGQKEEVLFRPAAPVKHMFNNALKKDRPRQPSVYDTIKHMLDMEKSLEKSEDVLKPAMRKRIITTEDSLTRQLSVLKKHD